MPSRSLPASIVVHLEKVLRAEGLVPSRLLLAVSGGADSTALMVALAALVERLALEVHVATVDHGLRPEARMEAEQVAALARTLGLSHERCEAYVAPGPAIEARARELRYAALETCRERRGLDWIVTAHTASDQAETVLMRLARGSALRGARAILARSGRLLRPLLGLTRAELRAYLEEAGVPYAQDPMNVDPAFFRVRMRQSALPAVSQAAGFDVTRALARFAEVAGEDEQFLQTAAQDAFERLTLPDGMLDAVGLRALPAALRRRVLVTLLVRNGVPVDAMRLQSAGALLTSGGRLELGQGRALHVSSGRARVVKVRGKGRNVSAAHPRLELNPDGAPLLCAWAGWTLRLLRGAQEEPAGSWSCGVDERWLPLTVRARQPGDVLVGRGRKLQDLLVDARVPAETRDLLALVTSADGEVVAVPGLWPAPSPGGGTCPEPPLRLVASRGVTPP